MTVQHLAISDFKTDIYQLLQAEQPWLKYTAILKDSPNWDEFLEILAEARREDGVWLK